MQFTIATALTFAAAVMAAPTYGTEPSNPCSSTQTIACCDAKDAVLGAQCSAISLIEIIGGSTCSPTQTTQCCETEQNGLINLNLSCIPITIVL